MCLFDRRDLVDFAHGVFAPIVVLRHGLSRSVHERPAPANRVARFPGRENLRREGSAKYSWAPLSSSL